MWFFNHSLAERTFSFCGVVAWAMRNDKTEPNAIIAPFYHFSAYIHVSNIVNLWTLSHRNFRDNKIKPLALRAKNLVCKSITLKRYNSQTQPSFRVTYKQRLQLFINLRYDVTHIYTLSSLKIVRIGILKLNSW